MNPMSFYQRQRPRVIISKGLRLNYVPTPKVGCTSMKALFFQHEFPGAPMPDNIHKVYPTLRRKGLARTLRDPSFQTVGVFRDPEERFLSGFKDRVLRHKEVVGLSGKDPLNNLQVFLDRFQDIKAAVPAIQHHFAPQTKFLGIDPMFYDVLVPLDLLSQFMSVTIGAATANETSIYKKYKTTEGIRFKPTVKQGEKIRALCFREYKKDYAFLWQAQERRLFFRDNAVRI